MNESRIISINRDQTAPKHNFPEPKGHEKILAGCKKNRLEMDIYLMDGTHVKGEITQFDRWTITLKDKYDHRRTYFKHSIESFGAVTL